MANRSPSYFKAALLMPANLFALAAGGAASFYLGEATPLLAAAGGSALYLTLLSWLPSFRRRVRNNFDAQELGDIASPEEVVRLLQDLAPSQREHYGVLAALKQKILESYLALPGGRVMAASSERRLDGLLTAFLRLVTTLNSYRKYLNATDRQSIEDELKALETEVDGEKNERLREVKARRVDILKKRVARFRQAEESREVVSHQLAGIEDVLRLTHEQAIVIRDPQVVQRQLEALTTEVEATEETVREMERFMEFTDEVASIPVPQGEKVR